MLPLPLFSQSNFHGKTFIPNYLITDLINKTLQNVNETLSKKQSMQK